MPSRNMEERTDWNNICFIWRKRTEVFIMRCETALSCQIASFDAGHKYFRSIRQYENQLRNLYTAFGFFRAV